jgi:hypothetical protein
MNLPPCKRHSPGVFTLDLFGFGGILGSDRNHSFSRPSHLGLKLEVELVDV